MDLAYDVVLIICVGILIHHLICLHVQFSLKQPIKPMQDFLMTPTHKKIRMKYKTDETVFICPIQDTDFWYQTLKDIHKNDCETEIVVEDL